MTLSLLGSATWSVLDFVRTDLRTVRLAIATATAATGSCTPRKSQVTTIRLRRGVEPRRAVLAWAKRTSRAIDCKAIGGSVGGKGPRRVRAGEKVRAVRDQSALIAEEERSLQQVADTTPSPSSFERKEE